MHIFHLAIPTDDIAASKKFYVEGLGASLGREYDNYAVFDFYGHQLVYHLDKDKIDQELSMYPRHFGIIFQNEDEFTKVYERAKEKGLQFFKDMFERFKDKPGGQKTFFLADPSNNLIEFKFYDDFEYVLGK